MPRPTTPGRKLGEEARSYVNDSSPIAVGYCDIPNERMENIEAQWPEAEPSPSSETKYQVGPCLDNLPAGYLSYRTNENEANDQKNEAEDRDAGAL